MNEITLYTSNVRGLDYFESKKVKTLVKLNGF